MEIESIERLRERHPSWKLLRAHHAPLIIGFLGRHFVADNAGPTSQSVLITALDDYLFAVARGEDDEPRYPKSPVAYLEDWSQPDSGWLRRFYPADSDEIHYDATPAFEKSYAWVESLQTRAFIGTESRLHTVVDLLKQIVYGAESDPEARLAELRRQRDEIDRQIADVEAGQVDVLSDSAIRDRYQQLAGTARELLSDFREVEENFRSLDRAAREKIAGWQGAKGDLLTELVRSRTDIASSDQGRSFRAFYDFLLSEARQDELADLLASVQALPAVSAERRLGTIHHDWSDAAERTQQTVRQISEQLRRFLDDQVWLENRRVADLLREIEAAALRVRDEPPDLGLAVDQPGVRITLPFERPLYDARPAAEVDSMVQPTEADDVDVRSLFAQKFVDHGRLADNVRAVVPRRATAQLADIIALYPIEQGVAELVGYLALPDDDLDVTMDETEVTVVEYSDLDGLPRRARMPKVMVTRR